MTLIEIAAGVFMSGIMIAVLLMVAKPIRDTQNIIKNRKTQKSKCYLWQADFVLQSDTAVSHTSQKIQNR